MMPHSTASLRIDHALRTFLLGFALLSAQAALAQAQKHEHQTTLRVIMNDLRGEYLKVTNALLTDDFKVLESSARAIEGHPLPDEIVTAIKSKLGKNFHAFEAVDERSHKAAADLAKRAVAKDISGSAKAFGRLAESCVDCHRQFRATLRPLSD